MTNIEEQSYLDLLNKIITTGSSKEDRTGVGTKSIFGTQLRFSLENNKIPMLTTKKIFYRGVIEELLFFIRGETDTKILEAKGVNIWKGNTSREFLNKRGLAYLPEGNMGKGYGFQWRNFGGHNYTCHQKGVDQLSNALDLIKTDPNSRKIIISAWNPQQLDEMVLPPCHCFFQFYVNEDKLSLHWYQRSVDTFLGLPFNIASYALLTIIMAKAANLNPHEIIFSGGDTHCYLNHIDQIKLQLNRAPFDFPKIFLKKDLSSIEDIEKLSFEDFELSNYNCHPAIKAPMAI
jgi:thymidylate synthase